MSPIRLSIALLAGLATMAGCGRVEPGGADDALVVSIDAPAEVGSGEPFLSTTEDAVLLSWLESSAEGGHDLWLARMGSGGWSERRHVAHSDRFFVNWADFPSVSPAVDGSLWAHWLQRGGAGEYDYGIRVARSTDGGASWSEPWTPHEDGTPTEHGFVSVFPMGDGVGLAWLDGRNMAPGPSGEAGSNEMTVRFRQAGGLGPAGPETVLDARSCECCQTDAALTSSGPVVVYRDRSELEIRDVFITRWTAGGWTEGVAVHDDGWEIAGCPVNGPAVAALGERVVVAWFTGAGGAPRVHAAFSSDRGASFGAPIRVDGGDPTGRVDAVLRPDGSALVSWIERTGGEAAEIRLVRVSEEGAGEPIVVASSSASRSSGFPRLVETPWDASHLLMAWTEILADDSTRVRVARVELPAP